MGNVRLLILVILFVSTGAMAADTELTSCDVGDHGWNIASGRIHAPEKAYNEQQKLEFLNLAGDVRQTWTAPAGVTFMTDCFFLKIHDKNYFGVVFGHGAHGSQLYLFRTDCRNNDCKGSPVAHESPRSAEGTSYEISGDKLKIQYFTWTLDENNPLEEHIYNWPSK